jgi:hypothetical protein
MTVNEYFDAVNKNKVKLDCVIREWHPAYISPKKSMHITAPGAEAICEFIRTEIQQSEPKDALERFNKAVAAKDYLTANSILNETWFGVPESTECWNITGFRELVSLLEEGVE